MIATRNGFEVLRFPVMGSYWVQYPYFFQIIKKIVFVVFYGTEETYEQRKHMSSSKLGDYLFLSVTIVTQFRLLSFTWSRFTISFPSSLTSSSLSTFFSSPLFLSLFSWSSLAIIIARSEEN